MTTLAKLEAAEKKSALQLLSHWQLDGGTYAIRQRFQFDDFVAAFGVMTQVVLLA